MKKVAMLYKNIDNQKVRCQLCGHKCLIDDEMFGICGVRQNIGGTLYSHVYGELIASHIDPIEKKPLYHFLPGSPSLSIATMGCNFKCEFCQNWQISQLSMKNYNKLNLHQAMPERIVQEAVFGHCDSISYTYTEPTIFFEFAHDIAKLAKKENLFNVFVSNGFMSKEAIETIHPYLDACNIDLKSFRDSFYKNICGGRLNVVLDTIALMKKLNIWIEITTLIIPGLNDSKEELSDIANFIHGISDDIPWHISRFHGDYHLKHKNYTPIETMHMAEKLVKEAGLHFVYLGNVAGKGNNTYCYNCGEFLIDRSGYMASGITIKDSKCPKCNTEIAGIWN